jgi:hypothetical protein
MLIIPDHKRNANQNHTKIPPHSWWNNYHQEHQQQQTLTRMWGKGTVIYILLVGMYKYFAKLIQPLWKTIGGFLKN